MEGAIVLTLLASLRLGPPLFFAPPFSQLRVPMVVRVCLVMALSLSMSARVDVTVLPSSQAEFLLAAFSELLLGLAMAFGLQTAFAALSYAGRIIDIQAGYSLALVIDPATRAQSPLFGSIFTWTAGVVFLANDGHLELLRVIDGLASTLPIGQARPFIDPMRLVGFFSLAMGTGLGLVGGAIVVLMLIDLTIAFLSRTLPQMNALMLGFQVKAVATLLTLALTAPLLATVVLRLIAQSFDYVAGLALP